MSDIEKLLQRAQKPGSFGRVRAFSLEQGHALRKMREYAQTNPSHFVLELIQAALANGARYLAIDVSTVDFRLSYVGEKSGYSESRLQEVFDQVLTAPSGYHERDLRALAMGLNALLSFSPRELVVESCPVGQPSTRLLVQGDNVQVGRPSSAVSGTFISAPGGRYEPALIEDLLREHCLACPIPILLNGNYLYSFQVERFAIPFGYANTVRFDEGDLFGTVGQNRLESEAGFQIIVDGVKLWTFRHAHSAYAQAGGIVHFARLRKTVDHADAVRDAVWLELWARLEPYLQQSYGKPPAGPRHISLLQDGSKIPLYLMYQRLDSDLLVVAPDASSMEKARALIIAEWTNALPVLADEDLRPFLREILPRNANIFAPHLGSSSVLEFFNRELRQLTVGEHTRPLPALRLIDLPLRENAELSLLSRLESNVRVQLVADFIASHQSELRPGVCVRLFSFQRCLWEGYVDVELSGISLEVELPQLVPAQLELLHGPQAVATFLVENYLEQLKLAESQYLSSVSREQVQPGTPLSQHLLRLLARDASQSLQLAADGSLHIALRTWSDDAKKASTLPLLRTLTDQAQALVNHLWQQSESMGLVYGVRHDLEHEAQPFLVGLKRERILSVDATTERALVQLFGETGYVRVDGRDILAQQGDLVLRDVALGLRSYPEKCALIERLDSSTPEPDEARRAQDALLTQLLDPVESALKDAAPLRGAAWEQREWFRQALRHLQWAAVQRRELSLSAELEARLRRLPAFVSVDDAWLSIAEIEELADAERLGFVPGPGRDVVDTLFAPRPPTEAAPAPQQKNVQPAHAPRPITVHINPFLLHLLLPQHRSKLGAFADGVASRDSSQTNLATLEIESEDYHGQLALSPHSQTQIAVIVDQKVSYHSEIDAPGLCVRGTLTSRTPVDVQRIVQQALPELVQQLLQEASNLGSTMHAAALQCCLQYLRHNLRWEASGPSGQHVIFGGRFGTRISESKLLRLVGGVRVSPHWYATQLLQRGYPPTMTQLPTSHPQVVFCGELLRRYQLVAGLSTPPVHRTTKAPLPAPPPKFVPSAPLDIEPKLEQLPAARPEDFGTTTRNPLSFFKFAASREPQESTSIGLTPTLKAAPALVLPVVVTPPHAEPPQSKPHHSEPPQVDQARADQAQADLALAEQAQAKQAQAGTVQVAPTQATAAQVAAAQAELAAAAQAQAPQLGVACANGAQADTAPRQAEQDDIAISQDRARQLAQQREEEVNLHGYPLQTNPQGRVLDESLRLALYYWLKQLSPRAVKIQVHTARLRDTFWSKELWDIQPQIGFTSQHDFEELRLGPQRYASNANSWLMRGALELGQLGEWVRIFVNQDSAEYRLVCTSPAHLQRAFPRLLLSAYSTANYISQSITPQDEQLFQLRLAQKLVAAEPFLRLPEQQ